MIAQEMQGKQSRQFWNFEARLMPTSADDCSNPQPLSPSAPAAAAASAAEPLSRSIFPLSITAVSARRRAALSSLIAGSPPQDDSVVRERNPALPSSPGHAFRIAAPSDVFFDPMTSLSDAKDDCLSFVTARVSDGTACSVGARSTVSDFQDEDSRRNPGSSGDDDADDECSSSSSSWCSGWSSTAGGWWAKKPHQANDARWDAIRAVSIRDGRLGLGHFRLLERLGSGDIGCVYLAELRGKGSPLFAVKVMDKAALVSRKKLSRAHTEREILQCLDHPFLPTLYAHFETENFSCLVMEFYSGGDLRDLQQRQPGKCFTETAARFYIAEVLLALEYLHMLGIIYRDLKPENVLVRDDGHIVLSDFDLSLRCVVFPTLVKSTKSSGRHSQPSCIEPSCMKHSCLQPTCFSPHLSGVRRSKASKACTTDVGKPDQTLPVLIAEPSSAHSMSFVGTHEYLAPEIIKGEGHGSAVDWWSFGILLYELLFGKTPFKGSGNRATLFNVVGEPLEFPELPTISFAARDLIKGLLLKEPQQRLAYRHGTAELKQHPFFQSINWALIRCESPPEVPKMNKFKVGTSGDFTVTVNGNMVGVNVKPSGKYLDMDFF